MDQAVSQSFLWHFLKDMRVWSQVEEVRTVLELTADEQNPRASSLLSEAASAVQWLQASLDSFEVRQLLSGQYDDRSATLSIVAGAGGVDAQVSFCSRKLVCQTLGTKHARYHASR